MRRIAATYVIPGFGAPLKNGILTVDNDGTIIGLDKNNGNLREEAGLEHYSGILVPGFVNVHCHLELSKMKGLIPEHTGIGDFIGEINKIRHQPVQDEEKMMKLADRRMWAAGTTAVGDISNTAVTARVKKQSKIYYHTFVEAFGFHPSRAERAFDLAQNVIREFREIGLTASVVPHSPYSVSEQLFVHISNWAQREKSILSIHNQESEGEKQFFHDGTGPIATHIGDNLGIDISHWKPTGKSSLASVISHLPKGNQLLLVHNTFTEEEDLRMLIDARSMNNTWLVLCPNSNLYIENQLPPLDLFRRYNMNICLGTDSLASNRSLSVLNEMITLQVRLSGTKITELIQWACLNGAKALGIEEVFGSFEAGKRPGVNLITGVDLKNLKLTENSKVKRLV